MSGVLLDTNALLWWRESALFSPRAAALAARERSEHKLFVRPISAWEIGVAARKNNVLKRPYLRGLSPRVWFDDAVEQLGMQTTQVSSAIATEAADLGIFYGSGDPGDCFLIATAHVLGFTLITRDARILASAEANPAYVTALRC